MIDRFDAAGAVGLLLILTALWAAGGWVPVAALLGVTLVIYAYIGADNRGKKR